MRLLCDEMLAGFGRWLRAAGYDTALARPGRPDRELVERAAAEGRVLLTADRLLARRRTTARILLLQNDFEADAAIVKRELGIDWLLAPFSRCVMDNTVLHEAGPEAMAKVPAEARGLPGPFMACPTCGRVYWPGSHVKRMRARLETWAGRA
ncbi:MAG: DUF5615 family PIN-like protein [Proteobacteria bacterium]|nr:DUF5615 family PIN-like protein [Pseudomonadota bacterium]